jgi:hypothetical protein
MTGWKDVTLRKSKEFERKDPIRLVKGLNRLKFLDDGRDIEVKGFDDPSRVVQKVVFDVEQPISGISGPLFVNYGETEVSLFGQLQELSKKLGDLTGHTLGIVSTTGDINTRYSIMSVDGEPV